MTKKLLVVLAGSGLIIGLVIGFRFINIHQINQGINQTVSNINLYQELTIPYLRNRNYQSSLSELQQISRSSNYTSYLTSYDSDGLKINGLLTIPNGVSPNQGWPAVVFVHGYIPPATYRTQEKYVDYVNYLANRGLVVFKIDLRGHGESEGMASGSYYSSDYVIDTLNALAALKSADFVNPSAIGLWGHSMSGNIVLRSVAVQPDIPAVVIWAGAGFSYEDLQKYGLNDNSYRRPSPLPNSSPNTQRQQIFATFGEFSFNHPFWQQVAATNYLSDVKGAIQLHHAENDDVVNIGYSQDLNEKLNQTAIPHEFYSYPTGGHNLTGSSFSQAMSRTVNFYQKHLNK